MSLLSIKNVGKAFVSYKSELYRFARWFGMPVKPSAEHWVIRHISFDIHSGEAIGIIGQNGAGKSTLLKMITGTLQPTEGQIQVNGRIAAILELGMGFNPELTGRQNVIHAAGLMGFNAEQVQQAMPDIETFAEVGEYFDEPVRTYSSGMQMRVAFAVATTYRPEILIVD
ncbi:MAG: ABC transporter ATP-binding protein, partial [Nitrosomonas sp.]|nr:ABC transporter ATP-binding protein [Nitrosomonas sp.]